VTFTRSSPKRHRQAAQALIEFTLVAPVMLLMVVGLLSLGRAFIFGVAVQEGTRQAARLAASSYVNAGVALTNSDLLGRLIAGSDPALGGCLPQLGAQSCNGGVWTLSVAVVGPSGAQYTRIEDARAANDFAGGQITVTAAGAVALLPGVSTGNFGLTLPQIRVQGQAAMVVL
jgi:Flp pilus assembly protein TadG